MTRRATSEWTGEVLGQLHGLPLDDAPNREGGGWHHLSLNGGGRTQDIALLHELLADTAGGNPEHAASINELRAALDTLDLGAGLPEAMVHVDFGGPNVLRDKERYTVIDWTVRAPRRALPRSHRYWPRRAILQSTRSRAPTDLTSHRPTRSWNESRR